MTRSASSAASRSSGSSQISCSALTPGSATALSAALSVHSARQSVATAPAWAVVVWGARKVGNLMENWWKSREISGKIIGNDGKCWENEGKCPNWTSDIISNRYLFWWCSKSPKRDINPNPCIFKNQDQHDTIWSWGQWIQWLQVTNDDGFRRWNPQLCCLKSQVSFDTQNSPCLVSSNVLFRIFRLNPRFFLFKASENNRLFSRLFSHLLALGFAWMILWMVAKSESQVHTW